MLIVRPIHYVDESPSSIFMRAASLNGLEKIHHLLQFQDKDGNQPLKKGLSPSWRSPALYRKYMADLGIELPKRAGAYRQEKTIEGIRVYFNDDVYLPSLLYRQEGTAVCPKCLAEKPYLRKLWSLKFIDKCPVHQCDLIFECPNCFRALTWHRTAPERCNCKYQLAHSECTFLSANSPELGLRAIQNGDQFMLNYLSEKILKEERKNQRLARRFGYRV